jgi:hypothetical protein
MTEQEGPQNITSNLHSIKFISWWWNGLLALTLACIVIVYTYIEYDAVSVGLFERGTWLILGGFSLFFPTGGFLFIMGIPMFIGVVGSINQIEIQKEQSDRLVIRERRFGLILKSTNFDLNSVKLIKLEVGRFGIKMIWVFIFGLHAIYLLNDGLHLITNPFLFGYGTENALVFIITGIVEIMMIIIIIFPGEEHLEIHTNTEFHLLRFHIWRNKSELIYSINSILGIQKTQKDVIASQSPKSITFVPKHSQTAIKYLVYGLVFWIIAIISRILNFYAGTPLRLALYFIGWFAILYGIKFLSNKKEKSEILGETDEEGNKKMIFHIYGKMYQSHVSYKKPDKAMNLESISPRPMPFVLLTGIIITLVLIGWTFVAWVRFTWGNIALIGWTILYLLINLGLVWIICDLSFGTGVYFSMKDIQFPKHLELLQLNTNSRKEDIPIERIKNIENRRQLGIIICISLISGLIFGIL